MSAVYKNNTIEHFLHVRSQNTWKTSAFQKSLIKIKSYKQAKEHNIQDQEQFI